MIRAVCTPTVRAHLSYVHTYHMCVHTYSARIPIMRAHLLCVHTYQLCVCTYRVCALSRVHTHHAYTTHFVSERGSGF